MNQLNYSYTELPTLEDIYLEDSWVLAMSASYRRLVFVVEFVLTPGHPSYRDPEPGKQYCSKTGELRFERVTTLSWVDQTALPAVDASGDVDYGAIDTLARRGNRYELTGDFGTITVVTEELPVVAWP